MMGLLASQQPDAGTMKLRIAQGVEMGRPSLLEAEADHSGGGGVAEVRIGGHCVPMMRGELVETAAELFPTAEPSKL